MQIHKSLEIIDLSLFHTSSKTLIIPDVHIGYEEALNKQGILIPRIQFNEIMKNIEIIIKKIKKKYKRINQVIILGDLKHEFGTISETEWRHTLKFLDYLSKHTEKIILLKGNHDKILGPIAKKRDLEIVDEFIIDNILLTHGDTLPTIPKPIKTIIIGHEHCAISLKDGARVEKFKCFIKGRYKKFNLIATPSFNPIIEGTDLTKEALLSPFLKNSNIKNFNVYITADKIYNFGKLKKLL